MLSFIFKNLKYLFDVAIVIALLLVFAYWDPFGLFGTKVETKDTANLVTQIRGIGELTTAEYYGEVIASWKEGKLTEFKEDSVLSLAKRQYKDLKFTLWEVYENSKDYDKESDIRVKRRKLDELVINVNPKLRSIFYLDVLNYVGKEKFKFAKNEDEVDVLWAMYSDMMKLGDRKSADHSKVMAYLEGDNGIDFSGFFNSLQDRIKKEFQTRKNKNKNIVFIGRGWVKAGFDFARLNENNFFYDEDNATITFIGIQPKILDSVINPWFIPENQIKGFELVNEDGDLDFEDAVIVKAECKRKLMEQAVKAKIIDNAYMNGQNALKNFFSLVLGVEIRQIRFTADKFYSLKKEISKDSLIALEEGIIINAIYKEELGEIQNEKNASFKLKKIKNLRGFLSDLQKCYFLDKSKNYTFNYFSAMCGNMLGDYAGVKILDKKEMDSLKNLRWKLEFKSERSMPAVVKNDSIWFESGSSYMTDFNSSMDMLSKCRDSIYKADFTLNDLKFDYPQFEEYLEKQTFVCKTSPAEIKLDSLKQIHTRECKFIETKIAQLKQAKQVEKEEYYGITYNFKLYRDKLQDHFKPGK